MKFEINDTVCWWGAECIVKKIDEVRNRYFVENIHTRKCYWVNGEQLDEF